MVQFVFYFHYYWPYFYLEEYNCLNDLNKIRQSVKTSTPNIKFFSTIIKIPTILYYMHQNFKRYVKTKTT